MSQNDLVIANQTFPATRADITNALQALGSTNSGATEPSTTYANMLWYDTTSNTLKIRSEANDAWISIGYLDQSSQKFEPENAVPIGAVNTFAMNSAPTGWLSCDGSLVSRATYSGLFSLVGTLYGVGNGSTTFSLPDLRGEFVRGFDAGRGVDTGRAFGSSQADAYKQHRHTLLGNSGGAVQALFSQANVIAGIQNLSGSFSDPVSTMGNGNGAGTETRPRNIALLYCIKY